MKIFTFVLTLFIIASCNSTKTTTYNNGLSQKDVTMLRHVNRNTLISKADPPASFEIHKSFHYTGGQTINILNVASAEQYFFIDAASDYSIRRFVWVQFEHYNPDNKYTYDYTGMKLSPVQIGRIGYLGDVRVLPNYFIDDNRVGSDSKAAENFLRTQGFKLDGTYVTLRLFHLPDTTKRRELMIIYGEVLNGEKSEEQMKSEITRNAQANIKVP